MAASNPIVQSIVAGARARNIDPNAVLAVSRMEGLSGGIGDGGHAFGPFQLNNAGGVITGKFQGETPEQIQQWAQSPQGINYALDGIAKVASGLHGPQAVNAIVQKFERPANPTREIQGALQAYGSTGPSAAAPVPHAVASSLHAQATPTAPAQAAGGSPIFAALQLLGFDTPQQTLGVTQPQVPQQPAPKPQQPVAQPAQPSALASHISQTGPVEQLPFVGNTAGVNPTLLQQVSQAARAAGATQIRITSGARSAAHNQAVGGVQGSNHLTGDALDGYGLVNGQWVPLGQLLLKTASRYGLRSGDVPGFFNGGTDPVHVDDGANVKGRR